MPVIETPGRPSSTRPPVVSVRGVLASLTVSVGALHVIVADTRGAQWAVEGIGLATIGVVALSLGIALLTSRARWPLFATLAVSAAIVVALVVTRTSGYLVGPYADFTAPLGSYEILVLVLASIVVSVAAACLVHGIGPPGLRFDTIAPLVVVAAGLPGVAVSSWTDDVAYVTGTTHVHGSTTVDSASPLGFAYRTELTVDERRSLGNQLTIARAAALTTPTLAAARAAGWTPVGGPVRGSGQMMIDIERRRSDADFDPGVPDALLFASADDDAPIVAVQYERWTTSTTPPAGFTGQDMYWHLHTGTCVVDGVLVVFDEPHVGPACDRLGGTRTSTVSWMIRAWVVPGWENPNGTFAHDHPGVR